MVSGNLRRRIHHGDIDGRRNEHVDTSGLDGLNEPLLGNYGYDGSQTGADGYKREQDNWDDRKKEQLHWAQLFCNLVAQWGQWFANIIVDSGSVLGRMLPPIGLSGQDNSLLLLSPLQERRTGRRLGTGTRRDGLWYLDQGSVDAALASVVCGGVEAAVLLQHCRLGHLSFDSLSRLQPELMDKVDRSKLVCNACEFGKHTRSTYSSIGLRSV